MEGTPRGQANCRDRTHDERDPRGLSLGGSALAVACADYEDAEIQYADAARLWEQLGHLELAAFAVKDMAQLQASRGEVSRAATSYKRLLALYEQAGESESIEAQEARWRIATLARTGDPK